MSSEVLVVEVAVLGLTVVPGRQYSLYCTAIDITSIRRICVTVCVTCNINIMLSY